MIYGSKILNNIHDSISDLNLNFEKKKEIARKVLIGIQTFNGIIYTERLIHSLLFEYNNIKNSMYIVDNSSIDKTQNYLMSQKIEFEEINPRQCSAYAMNICLDKFYQSEYKYLLLLNNDVVLYPNFINKIVEDYEYYSTHTNCMLMCGVQVSKHTSNIQLKAIMTKELQNLNDRVLTGDYSAFITDRETVNKIGYFDERYTPRYIEDNDYTHRIYLSGGYCLRNGNCLFHHDTGTVFKVTIGDSQKKIMKINLERYKEKWGSYPK